MLILLPPSEGKAPAAEGAPLCLTDLTFPELTTARAKVLRALHAASSRPDAHGVLKVGSTLAAEVSRNTMLDTEPSAPAHRVYTGVLYDALDYGNLTPAQQQRARQQIVVISALWGALQFDDWIPAYRLSMSVNLPGIGGLASFWKKELRESLTEHTAVRLVIDCRSSTYAAAWVPPAAQTVTVNVLQERNGRLTVVSHFAKHTRGEFARHLLTRPGADPVTAEGALAAARERWTAELEPATLRTAARLNIVLSH